MNLAEEPKHSDAGSGRNQLYVSNLSDKFKLNRRTRSREKYEREERMSR